MIERWENDDGSETILVTDDPPRPSLLRRGLGILGKVFFILLVGALPAFFLYTGITGLVTGELTFIRRRKPGSVTIYGSEAVGTSWILIGIAIGIILYVFHEDIGRRIKWSLWLAATACFVAGAYYLLRGV